MGEDYIQMWGAEELATHNTGYCVREWSPGIVLFGSNGGGEAYGFDTRGSTMSIVRIPFITMELNDATPLANDIEEFLSRLTPSS